MARRATPPSAPGNARSLGTAGFASASDVYERGRPGYPDALLSELVSNWGLHGGSFVVDLAAGTGKLSRQLVDAGARCLAVEPSAAMRDECRRFCPGALLAGGAAEQLPLIDRCADLVTVAQGFHWFDAPVALHEMARVLRPNGALVLVWNERQLNSPWLVDLNRLLRRTGSAQAPTDVLEGTFDGDPHFSAFTRWRSVYEVTMTPHEVIDLVASRSYVRVLHEATRQVLLDEVADLVAPLGPSLVMPYVTSAYCARALPDGCHCGEEEPWSA